MYAQLRQRMADGRLAAVQPERRAGDVFFGQERMQRQQQVEIYISEFIHLVHDLHEYYRFP